MRGDVAVTGMPHCDECGTDARQVWRHRAFEAETRRTVRWVCRACHPDLRVETAVGYEAVEPEATEATDETASPGEAATADGTGEAAELRPDGGTAAGVAVVSSAAGPTAGTRCPVCLGETINGQGLYDCVDCEWSGSV